MLGLRLLQAPVPGCPWRAVAGSRQHSAPPLSTSSRRQAGMLTLLTRDKAGLALSHPSQSSPWAEPSVHKAGAAQLLVGD